VFDNKESETRLEAGLPWFKSQQGQW